MRRLLLLCSLALLLASLPRSVAANSGLNSTNVRVTDVSLISGADAEHPAIAAWGNTVYAVWRDNRHYYPYSSLSYSIYMAISTNGGATWSNNVRVSDPDYEGYLGYPAIAVGPNNQVWIAWTILACYLDNPCGNADLRNDVRLAFSDDGGATFTEVTAWDGNDASTGKQTPELALAPDTGTLYIMVHNVSDVDGDGYDIFLRILDFANQELRNVKLNSGHGNGRVNQVIGPRMSLTMRGQKICAAWEDRRSSAIYGTCSTDGGASFGTNFRISPAAGYYPRIALGADGTLFALYQQDQGRGLFLRRSSNLGNSWSVPIVISPPNVSEAVSDFDIKALPDRRLVVTWNSIFTLTGDLHFAVSTDNGNTFQVFTPVEDNQGSTPIAAKQYHARLAVDHSGRLNRVNLIWSDNRNTQYQIWSTFALLRQNVYVPLVTR
ncbi:sialidase family protein [Chloroflexus sp.]|uniref:sialidase family protein n=1 Tax=Chloroflexus sp. TaxID=1904827 RepID=UPI002ACEE47B|nr:sialidase family protein [Chloroflexus sp.]